MEVALDFGDNDRINYQEEEEEESFPSGFPETDVTLVVEEQKFHVSRAVLSQHSPVFKAMFNGHFKESTEKEIVLEDKKAEHFKEFLKSFYPNMKYSLTGKKMFKFIRVNQTFIVFLRNLITFSWEKCVSNVVTVYFSWFTHACM